MRPTTPPRKTPKVVAPTAKVGVNPVLDANVRMERRIASITKQQIESSVQEMVERHLVATHQRVLDVAETSGTEAMLVLHILMKRSLELWMADPLEIKHRDFAMHVASMIAPYMYRPLPDLQMASSDASVDESGARLVTLELKA